MPKRRSPDSPEARERPALDADASKRRRGITLTRVQALTQLNRALVELLGEQLRSRASGNWTKLLAQYASRVLEIDAAFAADAADASEDDDGDLSGLSLPSVASCADAGDEKGSREEDKEVEPNRPPHKSPPPVFVADSEEEEGADGDDTPTGTTAASASATTVEAADSAIHDDLPASPNPFAGGFSHSLPLDDEDEETDGFSGQGVDFVTTREAEDEFMAQASLSFGMDCFLPVNRSVGIWNEPVLLQRRIPSDQLMVHKQYTSGDFGDVFLGELCGQRVAIKRLSEASQNKANALRFASEIAVMSELNHPKIAAFVGVEWAREWEAQAVAEFVPHGDLRSLLDSPTAASLTWADFKCKVVLDVLDALVYLDQRSPRVVMEVLKARNVLISDPEGSSKLSVFAAARIQSVTDSSSGSAESSRWLAPEIILAEPKTDRSTIYSFGVLLSELDTGKIPFCDARDPDGSPMSSYKIAQLVTSGKLQPGLSEECPEPIAVLARQCMALQPAQRPTAASIGYKLLEILKNDL